MHQQLLLCVLWLLPLVSTMDSSSPLELVPRRFVPYNSENTHMFHEEGVFNYSTMLLREDLDLLVVGARGVIYALDLKDISKKRASVNWEVTKDKRDSCESKGKNPETECKNYIRILHKLEDNRMYVCGTYAFDPECDYMSYTNGKLILEKKAEEGKGKCPFDPFQRYASIMVEDHIYSATVMNFLGSDPVLMRSSDNVLRTEFKRSWLNEPNFVSLAQMPESDKSDEGDDDKVYLFFSETAVEYDSYSKTVVSRVARVCKGDLGGLRILQKKWTSFLKARLDCPVLDSAFPYIIQDTYHWCDPQEHWKKCLFFAVFTPQSDTAELSAICAYRVSDISRVFAEGKYKNPVHVETSYVKWVMYSGEVPSPRPGACIDDEARKAGFTQTLDLPDRTLQFVKDKPLMDQAIEPISNEPLLVQKGAKYSRIIVDQVQAGNGKKYHVMFIGTEEGTIVKAVNYNGEMFIIEEVQVFKPLEQIKILKFSNITRRIYAGSDSGVVQMSPSSCGRSSSCMDCVLSRDPYCGWDQAAGKCTEVSATKKGLIQSVEEGKASLCPKAKPVTVVDKSVWSSGNLKLSCILPSKLATTRWERNKSPLIPSPRHQQLRDGLLILNATHSDAGRYRCLAVERSKADEYVAPTAEYDVSVIEAAGGRASVPQSQKDGPSVAGLHAAIGLLTVCLLILLAWNFYKGHIPLPFKCKNNKQDEGPI
ncbi:semaphorin-4E-like [Neosynchiropus ocellatus]